MTLGQFVNTVLQPLGVQFQRVRRDTAGLSPDAVVPVTLGRFVIDVHAASPLVETYRANPGYSSELGRIAAAVVTARPDAVVVDVGANVGDTAAVIRNACDAPVIAIEGDDTCSAILERNARRLGDVTVVKRFLGESAGTVTVRVEKEGWNTTLQPDAGGDRQLELITLDSVVETMPGRDRIGLLKVDAEGFDFRILRGAAGLIAACQPVLFFEANRDNLDPLGEDVVEFLVWLRDRGYASLLLWDAYGRFIGQFDNDDSAPLRDLADYIAHGAGAVLYYDVCAFHKSDAATLSAVAEGERRHRAESAPRP